MASAEDPTTPAGEQGSQTVSKEQLSLYVVAQEHYAQGRYDAAIELLEQANAMGTFDLFEYSLGQVYAKQGECIEARAHLRAANLAPRSGPDLSERIAGALEELERTCPGILRVECDDPATKIYLDDGPALVCPIERVELSPGIHEIRAVLDEREERYRVGIVAMEEHSQRIQLTRPDEPALRVEDQPKRKLELPPPGRSLMVVGGGLLVTSLVLDLTHTRGALETYRQQRHAGNFEDAARARTTLRKSQALVFGLAGLGLASVGVGIVLERRGARKETPSSKLYLKGAPHHGGASLQVGVSY